MHTYRRSMTAAVVAISLLVAACGGPDSAVTTAPPTATVVTAAPTSAPAPTLTAAAPTAVPTVPTTPSAATTAPTAASASPAAPTGQASATGTVHFNVVADGTKANYRVREQLVRLTVPSDAVGTTTKVTGGIALGSDGKVIADQSKLVVDLTSLQSDSGMRDGFIGRNTLDLAQYPTATFVPTAIQGLDAPLPTSGQQTFQLIGNLTIHGVTKPTTLTVTSQVNGNDVIGQTSTDFKFEDFGMTPPHAGAVASVVDNVKLEVTLHLTKTS